MTMVDVDITNDQAEAWFALLGPGLAHSETSNGVRTACNLNRPVHQSEEFLDVVRPSRPGRSQVRSCLLNMVAEISNRCSCEVAVQDSAKGPQVLGADDLTVSISHSGPLSAVVVCRHADVGIDIEDLDRPLDSEAIARRFFTPKERLYLDRFSASRKHEQTLLLWTVKEAALKAIGSGLQQPLPRVERFVDGRPKRVTTFDGRVLWVTCLELSHQYVGSVVSSEALDDCSNVSIDFLTEETACL